MRYILPLLLTLLLPDLATQGQDLFMPANGPYGGTVTSMVTTAEGALVAGTDNGTYRSTDGGETWIRSSDGIPITSILKLARSPKGSLFAGTVDIGIYRSTDDGRRWHRVNSGAFSSYVWDIAVRSTDSMIVIAASDNGYASTDDGETWTSLNFTLSPYAVAVDSTQAVCAVVDNKLLRSNTPLAGNWDTTGVHSSSEAITTLGIAPDGSFIAGADDDGFHRSTDLGKTWTALDIAPELSSPRSVTSVADGRVFVTADGGAIYSSADSGATWERIGENFQVVYSLLVTYNGGDTTIRAMTSDGIQITTDGGRTWEKNRSNGIQAMFISALARRPGDGRIYAGMHNGLLYTTEGDGLGWEKVAGFERPYHTSVSAIDFLPNGGMIVGTYGEGMFRSTDSGATWENRWPGDATTRISALALTSSGTILAGCDSGRIYRSTDEGMNWELVVIDTTVQILAFTRDSTDRIWTGTSNNVRVSADDGKTWSLSGTGITTSYISAMATGPDSVLYAGSYNGNFFRSTNGGAEWKRSLVDPAAVLIVGLIIDANGALFAGTINRTLYRSTNQGANWAPYNSGITSYSSYALVLDRSGHVYVGTAGSGAFRSVDRSSSAPFPALQEGDVGRGLGVIPSPASDRVTLRVVIDHPSQASIEFTSVSGTTTRRIELGRLERGEQSVELSTADLPGGEWIVVMRVGVDRYVGRAIIVR